ncbi:hypothetical protein SAMN05660642_01322 [Geodermatophilus siccatus]|uniref:Uncharacterized protein n=1 Tax=Geodermatophilus siccatus TaxID=1137991 RepID=A0A1G9PRJ7_9ACTN|nr:hypothetical protein [Geodermatophilus siccatus]SDM01081.1 hypothetical protein SAMN05660642_01322 [Geodermatophilus siccatus]
MPDPADPWNTGDPEACARKRPLDADLIVVDESSVPDLPLVGDVDQQPSVGAGEVPRDLLHTAVVRAEQLVVLVGAPRALAQAVRANRSGRRHTALAHRLHLLARRPEHPRRGHHAPGHLHPHRLDRDPLTGAAPPGDGSARTGRPQPSPPLVHPPVTLMCARRLPSD